MFKCGYLSGGLYIGPSVGEFVNINHCCYHTTENHITNTNVDLLNNSFLLENRIKAINDQPPDTCSRCVKLEKTTSTSPRIEKLKNFSNLGVVKPFVDTTEIEYIQIRLSNLCNFKCIMCNENNSHLIAKEKNKKFISLADSVYNELTNFFSTASSLKKVVIAGGEPFYDQRIIDLIKYIPSNINLIFHTNGSITDYNIFKSLEKFKKVTLSFSIDGTDNYFNYQRVNGNFDVIMENINLIKSYNLPNIEFHCTSTITCINVLNLPIFIEKTKNIFNKIEYNVLTRPEFYKINLINPELLNKLKNNITDPILKSHINYAINEKCTDDVINRFWEAANYMKINRNVDIYKMIPEIKEIIRKKNV